MSTANWIWSEPHQDHYYVTVDQYNQPFYHWYKQSQSQSQSQSQIQSQSQSQPRTRHDSGPHPNDGSNVAQMPDPAPQDVRALRGFIQGTPHTGWYDLLDSSYRMRTGTEARDFFVLGRVFAMLYSETAGQTSHVQPWDEAYTVVRFNERVHTNIRRFVVLQDNRGFVYACGIGTYSGRGTLKEGCVPSEHAIVYLPGTDPTTCYLPGEYDSGMTKEPIEITPVDTSIVLRPESRIRFGKTYPIEKNVKVKDIGQVNPTHLSKLFQYWTTGN